MGQLIKLPVRQLYSLVLVVLWFLMGSQEAKAQLFQYSLYRFTPLNLNPALVAADDDQDASLIFRNQRIGNEGGIRSTQLNLTHPFLSSKGRWAGIGVQVTDDRSGESFFFKRNSVALALGLNLNISDGQSLSFGFSGEYARKSISADGWRTGSQWTGSRYEGSLPTGENFDFLRESNVNYHTGVYYKLEDHDGGEKAYAGVSLLYANQPTETFTQTQPVPSTFLLHAGVKVWDNGDLSLTPQLLWTNRASVNFLNVGTKISYGLDNLDLSFLKDEGSLDLGLSYVNQKAMVVGLTINQPSFNVGFSYDIDFNPESNVSGFRGAPEVALRVYNTLEKAKKKKKKKVAPKKKKKKKKTPKKKKKKTPKKKKTKKKSSTKKKATPVAKTVTLPARIEPLVPITGSVQLAETVVPLLVPSLEHESFRKRNLYFDFNVSLLNEFEEERVFLEKLVQYLLKHPDQKLQIIGHTDNVGAIDFNRILSFKRAHTVAKFLEEKGIARERIVVDGKGELQPMLPNTSETNKALNRRVEVMLLHLNKQ